MRYPGYILIIGILLSSKPVFAQDYLKRYKEKPFAHEKNVHITREILQRMHDGWYSPPYRNKEMIAQAKSFLEKGWLNRDNLGEHEAFFKFLIQYNFPEEDWWEKDPNTDHFQLKHSAAHTLGDYYFGQKVYKKAIEFYSKAVLAHPDEPTIEKDSKQHVEKLQDIVAACYELLNYKKAAYAFKAAEMISAFNDGDEEEFAAFLKTHSTTKADFCAALTNTISTIKKPIENYYTIMFGRVKVFFFTNSYYNIGDVVERLKSSELYRHLQNHKYI